MNDGDYVSGDKHISNSARYYENGFDLSSFFKGFFKNLSSTKKIGGLLVLVILVGGIFITVTQTQQQQQLRSSAFANGPILSFKASSTTVQVGQTFNIDIMLNTNGFQVTAAQLAIKSSSADLQIQGLSPITTTFSQILRKQGDPNSFIDSGGVAHMILGSGTSSKTGPAILLGRLSLKILSATAPTVNLQFDTLETQIAAVGQDVNVLGAADPITINISSPTSTPTNATPIPISTGAPTPTNTSAPTSQPPSPTPKKLGDVDGVGGVTIADFNEVLGYFGTYQTNPYLDADLDKSGRVWIEDFNEVLGNFGK